jgi:dihydrofolate reductase
MIRLIVAIDERRGMANDQGIPWQGKLPTDIQYFRDKISGGNIVMGLVTYHELKSPFPGKNFVLNDTTEKIREGFEEVRDLDFISNFDGDLWVIGGAGVFAQTITYADELFLTRLTGEYSCTKFFPEFDAAFELASQTEPQTENGITFHFEVWKRKQ